MSIFLFHFSMYLLSSTFHMLEVIKVTYILGHVKIFEHIMGLVLEANSTQMFWVYLNRKHGRKEQPFLDWAPPQVSNSPLEV